MPASSFLVKLRIREHLKLFLPLFLSPSFFLARIVDDPRRKRFANDAKDAAVKCPTNLRLACNSNKRLGKKLSSYLRQRRMELLVFLLYFVAVVRVQDIRYNPKHFVSQQQNNFLAGFDTVFEHQPRCLSLFSFTHA